MFKRLRVFIIGISSVSLLSWGQIGHRTIGIVAKRHLSQNARVAIDNLLRGSTLSEVSDWADEVRRDPVGK